MQSMHPSSFSQMQSFTPLLAQYQHNQSNSSVQYSNISNANQSSFSSASVQLTPESTSSSMRSTPSPMLRSTPSPMLRATPSPIRPSSAPSPPRMPIPQINEPLTSAKTLNTPLSCFTETRRPSKRPKDAVETAFCQMNTTLNTVASKIVQNQNDSDIQDPDVIIGKLVTAELKRTMEPMKSTLKRKFLEIMYSHNE
ncbi:PREDICTED: uncharacterized protein LOC108783214 [Cyphomyrmex costatus]|uniref:uncharacterized protein LOC108783214 n=1 Tax=Cyphomyrmex costatus TaxID=456900 RepID=UPI0008521EC6|nr:PREDICTED: uncharacterized protein LOC108783214 [Cyphomyrmex costatus]